MTTSGVYSFSVNRDQIIRMAMLIIGKLEQSEVPTAQETTDCSTFLNMLVKQWQGKSDFSAGLKTWTRKHGHLFLSSTTGALSVGGSANGWTNSYIKTTLSASAASGQPVILVVSASGLLVNDYIAIQLASGALFWSRVLTIVSNTITLTTNLPSDANSGAVVFDYTTPAQSPIVIETAFLRDINNEDTPLRIMTVQDYDNVPSKTDVTAASDPTAIYYEQGLSVGTVYTDTPATNDVTKHIGMTYMETVQDFVNPTDTPYYPQEWYLALSYGLAKIIAPIFSAGWTPVMEANAETSLAIAQKKEPEVTHMFFQPKEDGF